MTASDARCLHSQMDAVANTAEAGDVDDVRQKLTAMLRCSSQQGCSQAVACSDDAMVVLRRVLGGTDTND